MNLPVGFLLGGLIGILAWRARALSVSGACGAVMVGGLIFGLGGVPWAILLLAFFISSSGLSRWFSRRKKALDEKFAKGSQRDLGQVLANGGLGALLALAGALLPSRCQAWEAYIWVAYAGAMAAVNADTWATELGVLSRALPRLITTWRPVERGASGGISLPGTLAAVAGAALVGILAGFLPPAALARASFWDNYSSPWIAWLLVFLCSMLGGVIGSLFDSLLGASVQAIYYCPTCQKETERAPRHLCGTETIPLRGWRWLNNDLVNFACSLAGALAAVGFWWLLA
jgi:uncharacterized protein (TIGR00297 family)